MLFGLDGVEIGLIIVFLTLFAGIMTGFPVAFAIAGAGVISFAIIAALDSAGLLIHQAIDRSSADYAALVAEGVARDSISIFRYPDLPRLAEPVFIGGWEQAMERNLSFIVNRMNERVIAGQSIETLLAVLMFVMMGIVLERSRIAEDLLTSMARVPRALAGWFGGLDRHRGCVSCRLDRYRRRDGCDHGSARPADHVAQQLFA